MADNKSNNTEVGALWKRVAKTTGKTYLAGHITTEDLGAAALDKKVKIVVFSNNKEGQSENAPDFRMYLSKVGDFKKPETESVAEAAVSDSSDGDLI
jgi:uncharacterized protein (DUF736 family)